MPEKGHKDAANRGFNRRIACGDYSCFCGERFLECLSRAFDRAETILATVLNKARFWDRFTKVEFNERQREIVNRLLNGFEGKLTSSKWAKLAQCSQDTALRDIEDLISKKVLVKDAAGGRSTSYSLAKAKECGGQGRS